MNGADAEERPVEASITHGQTSLATALFQRIDFTVIACQVDCIIGQDWDRLHCSSQAGFPNEAPGSKIEGLSFSTLNANHPAADHRRRGDHPAGFDLPSQISSVYIQSVEQT